MKLPWIPVDGMLPGFNHNIRYRNHVFHVQTEDSGLTQPTVVTQLFLGGHVLAVERFDYADLVQPAVSETDRKASLKSRMQEQHKAVLKGLIEGRYDDRVELVVQEAAQPAEPTSDFDNHLPQDLMAAAETLPIAPVELPRAPAAPGPRTSVLRPGGGVPKDFMEEISVEGLVDTLAEWPGNEAPTGATEPARPVVSAKDSSQDTLVDVRLPAALRAAQERLRARTQRPARPSIPSSQPTVVGRPPMRPPSERKPIAALRREVKKGETTPSAPSPRTGSGTRPVPQRPRVPPANDKTMLEIDPLALKEAMARQRARLEAQRKESPPPPKDSPPPKPDARLVSEPSLDEVIMSYLKDQD